MHRRIQRWLERAPVSDGDRHGAVSMQQVLLLIGVLVPACWLMRLLAGGPLEPIERTYLVVHLGVVALAGWSLVCIRRGRFRPGAAGFVVGCLLMLLALYAYNGFGGPGPAQITHVFPLVLAGLLFGRRALWAALAFTVLCVLVGGGQELRAGARPGLVLEMAAGLMISFLVVAVVFDRAVAGLHASLADVKQRHRELEQARLSLKTEKEEREQAMDQLIHVQKVKAVGQLAGGVAHDFNNVLGVILGYAQWRGQRTEPAQLSEALAGVEDAARRGAAISRKLLNFSRQDIAHPEVFDIGEALGALESMLRQLFDPRVRIEMDLPSTSLPVRADRSQLELAILNVATNARDAMPDGGCFRLMVDVVEESRGQPWVEIQLSDTGEGMDESVRCRIFEPFFTTKAQSSGTGLGLAVVAKVFGEAGGEVRVDSTPGHGSRFRLRLPQAVVPARTPASTPPRVLLVDDDDELRSMLVAALEQGGCRVLGARDGREAWGVIARGEVPDVLVTDYRMPGFDGLSLIRRLRPAYPNMAMVLISDYLPDAAKLAHELPPDVERLSKPFSPDLLLRYVFMLATWPGDNKEGERG